MKKLTKEQKTKLLIKNLKDQLSKAKANADAYEEENDAIKEVLGLRYSDSDFRQGWIYTGQKNRGRCRN